MTAIAAGEGEQQGQRTALRQLLPHLWPAGDWDLRVRVMLAIGCLVAAKVANVYVPIFFKGMVDGLSIKAAGAITFPIAMLLAYGGARVLSQSFAELRDGVFAKVAQRAIRRVALRTFIHLHRLSLRFHLERQTGGLSRVIERGTTGIEYFLFFVLFNVVPTLLEIALVCGILWGFYNFWFALVTLVTIVGYVWYTLTVTEWRLKYRRRMNEADEDANTKAIDSLLNYET
ncbi:MAG TPA: ABC transporter transmembrane domain-containing protein, partial [Candidatus Angelobacter sp.]|nr:ABC transporter transmembrane domain-containing protein [Candidatus Angelobacter sp.]